MEKHFSSPRFLILIIFTFGQLLLSLYLDIAAASQMPECDGKIAFYGGPGRLAKREVSAINDFISNLDTTMSFSNSTCDDYTTGLHCRCPTNQYCCLLGIDFSNKGLTGKISPTLIANLTYLRSLDLSNNYIGGPIPHTLGSLKFLKFLDLSRNFLTGVIPAELGGLSSLKFMDLGMNNLSGRIPDDFGNLINLGSLSVISNQLSENFPRTLLKLEKLHYLELSDNKFYGALPKEIKSLTKLEYFKVEGNSFSGPIPEGIGKWKDLKTLLLLGNNFEGPLPKAIGKLENLNILMISDVVDKSGRGLQFPKISKLKSLTTLTLRNCSITDKFPIDIYWENFTSLRTIDFSLNKLFGEVPEAMTLLNLTDLYLSGNNLNGSIPKWLAYQIDNLDFSHNNFTRVNFLYDKDMLKNRNLYACCSLIKSTLPFKWEDNNFSCADEKPKNTYFYINCGGNETKINGSIYEADTQPDGASTIFVSPNKNWAYSSTGKFRDGDNELGYVQNKTCGINMDDAPLYTSARISPMSLKYYGFCLMNGDYTVMLHFAEIVYNGDKDYSSLGKRLFDVFIQDKKVLNNFNIKEEAGGPNKDVVMSFSAVVKNNRLVIHLYWAGKGSIYVPPGLSGPLISAISVTRVQEDSSKKLSAVVIVGISGFSVLLLVLILLFLREMGWLGKKDSRDEELKLQLSRQGNYFSFRDIKAATRNFHFDNKIGEGGFGAVYKGILNGMPIAVKQLSSKSKQGIKEFINEVGTISALNHPNLVRLLGCCTENDQLLLVYEFMQNNSLSNALFGSPNLKSRLDWRTRYEICLGIAKGLAFLHEESKVKIIHRDIKPTNVLLDEDLNAKISDFGLAKLWEGGTSDIITKITGTHGYMAPEYAMNGILTNKADVYSFGIVTLELMSGKNSTEYKYNNDETVFLLNTAYILQKDDKLLQLIDPDLMNNKFPMKEAQRVLDLAMSCTNYSPSLRPIMSEVVSFLEGKTQMIKSRPVTPPSMIENSKTPNSILNMSLSTTSGSTSTQGTSSSNPVSSSVTSNVEELDTPVQIPLSKETACMLTDKVES